MKLLLFKFCFLFVFFTGVSQNKSVFKKSLPVNNTSTLVLNLNKTSVILEKSTSNMIEFDYSIDFSNYSQKQIKKYLAKVSVEAKKQGDNVVLTANGPSSSSSVNYFLGCDLSIVADLGKKRIEDKNYHKSKDSLLREIQDRGMTSLKKWLDNVQVEDKNGKRSSLLSKKVKGTKSVFIIRVPNFIAIDIDSKNSQITLNKNIDSKIDATINGGFLRAKEFINSRNNFTFINSRLEVEKVKGGVFSFKDCRKVLIADVEGIKMETEGSKIQLGYIKKGVTIKDFNSEIKLYNFNDFFETFSLTGEYSKIYFFEPKTNYEMSCDGHNGTFYFKDGTKISIQPSKTGEKTKMMVRKRKDDTPISGKVLFDIVHTTFHYPTTVNINK